MLEVREYITQFAQAWSLIKNIGVSGDEAVLSLMGQRGYRKLRMFEQLKKEGVVYMPPDAIGIGALEQFSDDLGLFVEARNMKFFLLSGRYIIPIRDLQGNVIALVGWFPDDKKYLTTKSIYFSKSHMFYGMETMGARVDGPTILVEGIFDRIAMASMGYRSVATMGINTSGEKQPLYKLMGKRIIAIPDNDKEGTKVYNGDLWNIPVGGSYFTWKGRLDLGEAGKINIKDVDDLIKYVDDDSIHEMIGGAVSALSVRRNKAIL